MSTVIPFPGHRLERSHECCDGSGCCVCKGGLGHCLTCGGAEASLPTHCPQRRMTQIEVEAVSDGDLDYTFSEGWHFPSWRKWRT